jgi:hypothetical protein
MHSDDSLLAAIEVLAGIPGLADRLHGALSGDPEPSEEDLRLTAEVAAAARLLDLEFLDHLVIWRGRWVSIRSQRPTIWATTAAPD